MEPWIAFTVAGAAGWFIGFVAGAFRKSNQHRKSVSESLAFDRIDGAAFTGAGADFYLNGYRDAAAQRTADRSPGRHAIPRDYRGASADSGLARRLADKSDAAALDV